MSALANFVRQRQELMVTHRAFDRGETGDVVRGLAAGLVGGLAAACVMNAFQTLSSQLMQAGQNDSDDRGNGSDQEGSGEKQSSESSEPTTVRAASMLSNGTFHHQLSSGEKKMAGPSVHYGVATALGGMYGIAAEFVPQVTAGLGMPFGAAVAIVLDEGIVPATGLSGPPWDSPASTHAYSLVSHLVFGLTTEIVRRGTRDLLA
jgi:hypothetical protein